MAYALKSGEVKIVFEFDGLGDWVVYGTNETTCKLFINAFFLSIQIFKIIFYIINLEG